MFLFGTFDTYLSYLARYKSVETVLHLIYECNVIQYLEKKTAFHFKDNLQQLTL